MSFSQQAGWTPTPVQQPSMGDTLNLLGAAKSFQAQNAQANAYRAAIDPATGQFDQNKYNAFLIGQPAGAWGAGAAMQQAGNASSALGVGQQEQTKAQLQQLDNVNGVVAPVMAQHVNDQNIPVAQAQALLDQAHQAGLVNDVFYNQARTAIGNSPNGNAYSLLKSFSFANQDARTKLQATLPNYGRLDTGMQNIPMQENPAQPGYGQPVPAPGVGLTMSPNTAYATETITKGGQSFQVPHALAVQLLSQGWTMVPGAQAGGAFPTPGNYPGGPSYTPAPAPAPGGGTPAPAPTPQAPPAPTGGGAVAGPGAPTAPAPAPLPVPPVPPQNAQAPTWLQPAPPLYPGATQFGVGPPPGAAAPIEAGQKQSLDLQNAATRARQNIPLYNDMKTQLGPGQANVGQGSQVWANLRNLGTQLGVWSEMSGESAPTSVQAATERFNHDASLITNQQLLGLGNPTDARQEQAVLNTPSGMVSKLGNLGMIAMMQGNEHATLAEAQAWQRAQTEQGWQPGQFVAWQQQFNAPQDFGPNDRATGGRFDPRIFWTANMASIPRQGQTRSDQQIYASDIDKADWPQFMKNVNYAAKQGWVNVDPRTGAITMNPGL